MGSARLIAVFILVPIFFKITIGQQFSLGNKQDCGPNKVGLSDSGAQRLLSLISNSQANNNAKPLSAVQQYLLAKQNNQPSPIAQQQQQQCGNVQQQPSTFNTQQSQPNAQQSQPNAQQSQPNAADPNSFYTLPLNLQRQILQQIQQLQSGAALPGYQVGDQSSALQSSSPQPMSYGSLAIVNGQVAGPSQVSQGVLLSNLGLTSSLPSLIPNACNCLQRNTEQFIPQNNVVTNNVVTATPETTFSTKFIPITAIPMANNVLAQSPCSSSCALENSVANQLQNNLEQSARVEQQNVVPVQYQYQPVQQQIPTQGYQYAQVPQALPVGVDPQALLTSYVLSQLGPSVGIPSAQYQPAAPGYQPYAVLNKSLQNQGQKSSSLKTLVPLILNLLKEKEGCPCPNTNNNNCCPIEQRNYNDKPQVYQGYANQSNYGQPKRSTVEPLEGSSKNTTMQDSSDKSNSNQRNNSLENDEEVDDRDSYEDDVDD